MDPNDGSQGGHPGGHMSPFHGGWNQYGYQGAPSGHQRPPSGHQRPPSGYQGPPSWFQQAMSQHLPNLSMMHPSMIGPQMFYPPEIPSAFVLPNEEDTEEGLASPAPSATGKWTSAGTRTKQSNFNLDEDVNLVRSYLEIINDEVTANQQRKEQMWAWIIERYNLRRGANPERIVRSLQSRWKIIKAEASKFASYYAAIIRENPSGMSDADKTTHAAANFAGVEKHQFSYLHCCAVLKDEPNWQDTPRRATGKSLAGETTGDDNINLGEGNSSPTKSEDKRPMGRDQAKAAKKMANTSAGSSGSAEYTMRMHDLSLQRISMMEQESERKNVHFDAFQSHSQSLLVIEQEKLHLMRDKFLKQQEANEKQEAERILAMDLETLKPAQRVFYEAWQEEILEKIAARHRKRQDPAP